MSHMTMNVGKKSVSNHISTRRLKRKFAAVGDTFTKEEFAEARRRRRLTRLTNGRINKYLRQAESLRLIEKVAGGYRKTENLA